MDLDDTWTELETVSKYERVYPETTIPVATLAHGLDRTLFKPGVHPLKDLTSKRHRFTPYLENITQPEDFDYEAIQPYITSSKDKNLIQMAKDQKARYVGSTSSLSGILSHLYFKISNYRPVDISFLSRGFANQSKNHTRGSRVPKTILLRWKDGIYGVDVDKSFDTKDTILSNLGKSMEKVLTMEPKEYERYLKKNSSMVTEEERNAPEAYAYGRLGSLFLRSQLDCYHQSLPRRTFDLKTRATMPIRLDIPHYQDYLNYKLEQHHGLHYSFEREYYDMMRSAFLKYSFQVRIGHMDGIMVAYHNTENIFGFQYIKRSEMDARLFGTSKMGDEVFQHSLNLMQTIFDKATTQYPKQPVSDEQEKRMNDDSDDKDQGDLPTIADIKIDDPAYDPLCDQVTMYHLHTTSFLNGKKIEGPVSVNNESDVWDVCYKLEDMKSIPNDTIRNEFRRVRYNQATVFLPQSDESPKFLQRFKLKRSEYRKNNNDDDNSDNADDDKSTESPPRNLETPSTTST
ncbi:mitochondrial protein Pet127-domain-containing protein [Absidia repens]|uniref:Mitochondrial protein Pet127-domain-containing protein n=1 Tax=Absidia repens TaxID=90262 RepID=A0A1X2IG12_9FUNG|nr:mitochondrial protein Pet127-domain-containing protein [Absidia repens]